MVLASDRPSQQPGGKPNNGFDSVAVAKGRHGEKICRRLHHLPKVQKYAEHEHPLEKAEQRSPKIWHSKTPRIIPPSEPACTIIPLRKPSATDTTNTISRIMSSVVIMLQNYHFSTTPAKKGRPLPDAPFSIFKSQLITSYVLIISQAPYRHL